MKKYLSIVLFLAFFWIHSAEAATRTFVGDGASHNWSATGAWVEGIVPTAADDIVFSTNTAGSILVIDGTSGSPSLCRSIDTTNYTRTITMGATAVLAVGTSTSGAFKMTAGMTFAPATGALVKFVSTTTGNNITWGGYLFDLTTYDGVGGGWQWQDAFTTKSDSSNIVILTNGALDTNGQTAASVNFVGFSSNNSNTRSLTLGTTNWHLGLLGGSSADWNITNPSGMTLSAASSTITSHMTGNSSPLFAGGGLTYGTFTHSTLTTGTISFTGANTFGTMTLAKASGVATIGFGYKIFANQTVTGTFTLSGFSLTDRAFLFSDTFGTARTISAGTFAITNTDLRDITKAGAGSGDISATSSTTGNGDCGGNTSWTFQATRNVYMKTAVSVNWSAANWFTTSGGSTAAVPPLPLCQDMAVFDANSVTAGSKVITNDMARISGSTWTGVLNTPAFATGSTAFEIYGGVVLVSGMTHTGTGAITFMGRSAYSLDGGTLTWPTSSNITLNAPSGTYTLLRAFTSNAALTVTNGTLTGAFATTFTTYTQSGGTFNLGGTQTLSGAYSLSGGTYNMNSSNETGATTTTISGGTFDLSGAFVCSSTITISGGTMVPSGTPSINTMTVSVSAGGGTTGYAWSQ